ncbi:MAG: glycoside hydrolase family 9 protein, partial [Candidatus Thiodiazotropha sp.]
QITLTTAPAYEGFGPSLQPLFNYGQALQMAWYFYEAQRSGPLPKFDGDLPFVDPASGQRLHDGFLASRIPWRGDSDLQDGADVGLDLTGGWHDAGDHVKFGLPMAFSASFLAWSVLEFEPALQETGQLARAKDNLRWVGDYFIRAHPSSNELYGQVGAGAVDHLIWGSPEVMPHFRPAWKIDPTLPGPDLAAQTAAAMAAISLVFRADEPAYADILLQHAIELYDFAQATRAPETNSDKSLGRYSDSITDAQGYYASHSGAKDDLPFAAAWLYIATKTPRFLHDAEADYTRIADREGHHAWTAVWDDVRYGVYLLMAKVYADPDYAADSLISAAERHDGYFDYNLHAQNFLNHWLRDGGVLRTPGGMAWLSGWGSARYNTMTAFLALVYRKHLIEQGMGADLQENYLKFATEQVNYVLGDNPLQMSYLVGFGVNFSQVAHHRAAHGSSTNSINEPPLPRHVLYGGLAGGPDAQDGYTDNRGDFARTEVATDMNAGITGALAGLVDAYGITGNQADPDFPPAGPDYRELYVKAKLNTQQPTDLATGLEVVVVNESAYPPRDSDGFKFRYFVDLKEIFDLGFTLDDLVVETYWTEGADASGLQRWQDSAYIFYVEGSFEGVNITPLGDDKYQKHLKFIIRLPWAERGWDPSNDPSYEGLLANTVVVSDKIALYDTRLPAEQQLIWGIEPDPGILQSELPPPDTNPPPANDFGITLNVYSSWATGYCNKFTLTNQGSEPAQPTTINFVLPVSVVISNSWNGAIIRTGDNVEVALPGWVGLMQPGQSRTDFGFCASGTTLPQF